MTIFNTLYCLLFTYLPSTFLQTHRLFGQLIKQINLTNIDEELLTINTSEIKNGVYYLNIQVDGYRVLSEKVLIQRFY